MCDVYFWFGRCGGTVHVWSMGLGFAEVGGSGIFSGGLCGIVGGGGGGHENWWGSILELTWGFFFCR